MYAIIKTGGKQYKVAESDTIQIERQKGEAGDTVSFGEVLVVGGEAGITLGSPLYGPPQTSTNAWELYRLVRSFNRESEERGEEAPPVPTTSIYSRADGIVGWGGSVERRGRLTDNIEVNCASHIGLGVHPLVWYAIGDRLAQAQDQWRKFRPRGLKRALYPFHAPRR